MANTNETGTPNSVSVEIYDQVYHLRGVDQEYIHSLASLVDGKMRAVSAHLLRLGRVALDGPDL